MRILITGAAGFIGSNLCLFLLERNFDVIGIDNFSTGYQHNIDEIVLFAKTHQKNFSFIEGDLQDFEFCKRITKDCDAILHQAALGSVPRSLKTPHISTQNNVCGFVNLLTAAHTAGIKKVVYASSSSVYGDSEALPKQEDFIGNPLSPYAVTKRSKEMFGDVFAKCFDMDIIGMRYFNVFGPRQNKQGPYAAVIPLWIKDLLHNNPVYINGDGTTSRDFTFVENVLHANLKALQADVKGHHILNIAAGGRTTLNDLYNAITSALDLPAKPHYRDFRDGDIKHSLADITKAKELIGYTPLVDVKQGILQTTLWFKQQEAA